MNHPNTQGLNNQTSSRYTGKQSGMTGYRHFDVANELDLRALSTAYKAIEGKIIFESLVSSSLYEECWAIRYHQIQTSGEEITFGPCLL